MLSNESDRPRGYQYPKPSGEIGRTTEQSKNGRVVPLSKESIAKFRANVRQIDKNALLRGLTAKPIGKHAR